MKQNLRTSGIDIIGDVPWGTHFCQFYQTKEDLMNILVPYFKAGLENNEFCMWVTSQPQDVEKAKEALRWAVPDVDVYLERGQIEIIPYTHWYVKEGVFDSDSVLNGWIKKLNQALNNGYGGLRLTWNTFWLEKEDWNDFVNYEEEVDRVLSNYQMIALCTYCLDRCNATEIIDVTINHQFALIKRNGKWEQLASSKRREAEETVIIQSIERKKAEQKQSRTDEELCTSKEKVRVQSEEIQMQSTELRDKSEELDKANEALHESEVKYRNIVETANEGISVTDDGPRLTYVNDKLAEMLGYRPEEMIGRFIWDFADEEGKAILKRHREKRKWVVDGVYELKLIRKDGSSVWMLISAKALFDEAGEPTGSLAMFTDITKRKQEEQKIRRYNQILEGINRIFSNVVQAKTEEELGNTCLSVALELTGSLIGFVGLVDDDGLLHDIAISELGWNQCMIYDKTGHRRPPENLVVHGLYGRVIDSGKGFFTNKPLSHPDSIGLPFGHPPVTSFLGVPLVLDGKTMGVIAVADRESGYNYEQQVDLEAIAPAVMQSLQRKRSEEALREAYEKLQMHSEELHVQSDELLAQSEELQEVNKALHESVTNYRRLAENSPDVIARLDRQKRYIYANPAAEEPYGWSLNEIIGKTHDELILDSEEVKLWERNHEDVLNTGKNKIIEFYHISPQGKKYYFNTQIVPEFVDGEVTSVLAISRDITNIMETEIKLKETLESLEEKVKERTAELEEAYNLLKESEEGLAEAQRMAHIGNWDWEIRTDKLYLSDEVYRIYGCGPQEFSVTRNVFLSYVHPDDRDCR
jgi:PAS domain S-box-containing protein